MWTLKVILFLLPAMAYCKIKVRIAPGKTAEDTVVSFKGEDIQQISDRERETFKLDDASINKAVKAWLGNTCTNIYVGPPTGDFGDVYDKYRWEPVKRILRPVGYKINGIVPKPDAVVTVIYENPHDAVNVTYSTTIEKSVEEEIGHTWSTNGELSVGQEISFSVTVGAATVGASTSLSYTSGWGKDKAETRTVSIGTVSTMQVVVPPGQKALGTLTAQSATLEVDIFYEASLNYGDVFCNYANKYDGAHFYGHPLSMLQDYGNLPKKVTSTEHVSVGFYSHTVLKLENLK